jgi:hypothetical protein
MKTLFHHLLLTRDHERSLPDALTILRGADANYFHFFVMLPSWDHFAATVHLPVDYVLLDIRRRIGRRRFRRMHPEYLEAYLRDYQVSCHDALAWLLPRVGIAGLRDEQNGEMRILRDRLGPDECDLLAAIDLATAAWRDIAMEDQVG